MPKATTPVRPARIRNVALVGHAGAGTTTLAEAMLVAAGVKNRLGRVEDGSTVCDSDPEEIARGGSVSLAVADLEWTPPGGERHRITLLDAPGSPDFAGMADAALSVADVVLLCVSAVDGVQPGTRAMWRRAAELELPVIAVVTKEEVRRADFHTVMEELTALAEASGLVAVPLELPVGEAEKLAGLTDVLSNDGMVHDAEGHPSGHVPSDVGYEQEALHEQIAEEIVSHDDVQLARYLDGDVPDAQQLGATLRRAVVTREAMPILLTAATEGVGIEELLTYLCALAPSPVDRPARIILGEGSVADGGAVVQEIPADPDGELVLQVFRTLTDPYVGVISYVRVLSGTLEGTESLINSVTGASERVHAPFGIVGMKHVPTTAAVAGDIVGFAKLSDSPTGSLLAAQRVRARPLLPEPREAGYSVSLVPERPSDEERLPGALARLVAADPTLQVEHVAGQTVLRGLGDQHLAVAVERMARLLGVRVSTEPVAVSCSETIARRVEATGRLKKQSGGHGQFAVVRLRVSPLPRGAGLEFVDSVVGGSVPRQFIPAVERGVRDAMEHGGPLGHPVVDLRVELTEGKAHSVDSSEMAFRTAGALGLKAALEEAGTVLLEPISALTVRAPLDAQGDVMGDIAQRRGQVTGTSMSQDGTEIIVTARVPQSELGRYLMDLRALTRGMGEMSTRPAGFEEVHA